MLSKSCLKLLTIIEAPYRLLLTLAIATAAGLANAAIYPVSDQQLQLQRQTYLLAKESLSQGHLQSFKQHRQKLAGYPLAVHLDYLYLNRRLNRLPYNELDQFFTQHSDSFWASRLRGRLLSQLGKRQRWQAFLRYYQPELATTKLQCYQLQALAITNPMSKTTTLEAVTPLWNVGHSQPRECDAVFELWTAAGHLTPELAWQRFNKAIDEGNRTLANYLTRFLDGQQLTLGHLFVEVGRYPHRIRKHQRFQEQSADMRNLIAYGVKRYSRQNPVNAHRVWQVYDGQQLFEPEQRQDVQQYLAAQLLRKGHPKTADQLLSSISRVTNESVNVLLIRAALKQLEWDKVYDLIQQLPMTEQNSERWLYWRARAISELNLASDQFGTPEQMYRQLALQRNFYSFLAADKIGADYQLVDQPSRIAPDQVLAVAKRAAAQRAREFLAIKDHLSANREWFHMGKGFTNNSDHIAAAQLAHQWGWHPKTIQSLAQARAWNDLQLRFPLAYNKDVFAAAQKNSVSPLLLFAIARQESAFAVDARSPAGAMGLMQLMPRTAKQTASKAGVTYKQRDLYTPAKNIELGSFYITELLQQFNGNRVLATAAYNAGPHRVNRWLRDTAKTLPADVWIESIPFRETRKYVQNVLAYAVIYGYRTGTTPELLNQQEATTTL